LLYLEEQVEERGQNAKGDGMMIWTSKRLLLVAVSTLLFLTGRTEVPEAHARGQWVKALKQRARQGFARWARRHPGLAARFVVRSRKKPPSFHRRATRFAAAGLSVLLGSTAVLPTAVLGQGLDTARPVDETHFGVVVSSPRGSMASHPYGNYTIVVKQGREMEVKGPDDKVLFTLGQHQQKQTSAPATTATRPKPGISISGSKVHVNGDPVYSIGGNEVLAKMKLDIDVKSGEIRYLAPDGRVVGRLRSSGTPGSFHLYRPVPSGGEEMVGTIALPQNLLPTAP
jgi:hypothetical protein